MSKVLMLVILYNLAPTSEVVTYNECKAVQATLEVEEYHQTHVYCIPMEPRG